jgi:hypothetical protein
MFEFFLADRLRMTVDRLRAEMSNTEYMAWVAYHSLRAQREEMAMKKG